MSDSLWPHGLPHTRLLCPSLSPVVCSNSCPLSRWCYLTISSSAASFSFGLQSFPTSGSYPVSQFLASGGQSIRVSATASVLPVNTQGHFLLGLTALISLLSKGLVTVFSSATIQGHQLFGSHPSFWPSSHIPTWLLGRPTPACHSFPECPVILSVPHPVDSLQLGLTFCFPCLSIFLPLPYSLNVLHLMGKQLSHIRICCQ